MLRILQLWRNLRSSLWFLPGLIVVASALLAVGLVIVDSSIDENAFRRWPRIFGSSVDGARGLLTTVASSMITVVGIVFSVTVVALSLASSQYTSRVLRNFMRDRVTQWALGLMVGVFAYCLLVLRFVQDGPDDPFVPSLATLGGLVLAFAAIVGLIYFIHHISSSIQAAHILAAAAQETISTIDRLYPEVARFEQEQSHSDQPDEFWQKLPAVSSGYLETLDLESLVRWAHERDSVVRLHYAVGDFVVEGAPILEIRGLRVLDNRTRKAAEQCYVIGLQRTIEQDVAFGIRQIVDTALKALSPGINDSTTAVMCIERLAAIMYRLGERQIPTVFRDEKGEVRLVLPGPTYSDFLAHSFAQIRRSAAGNVAVLETLVGALRLLEQRATLRERCAALREQVQAVAVVAARSVPDKSDLQRLEELIARLGALLETNKSGGRGGE